MCPIRTTLRTDCILGKCEECLELFDLNTSSGIITNCFSRLICFCFYSSARSNSHFFCWKKIIYMYFYNKKVRCWQRRLIYEKLNKCGMNCAACTIQKISLIWISRSFKKWASDNTINYFDHSFRFSGLWLMLARNLGRSGQNKSWGTENRERTCNPFFLILNSECRK